MVARHPRAALNRHAACLPTSPSNTVRAVGGGKARMSEGRRGRRGGRGGEGRGGRGGGGRGGLLPFLVLPLPLLLVFPGSILEITCPGIRMSGSTSGTLTWDTILLGQGLAKCSPWAKSGPPAVCINKVLLELSHTSSFLYPLWLLWWWKGRVKYLQ